MSEEELVREALSIVEERLPIFRISGFPEDTRANCVFYWVLRWTLRQHLEIYVIRVAGFVRSTFARVTEYDLRELGMSEDEVKKAVERMEWLRDTTGAIEFRVFDLVRLVKGGELLIRRPEAFARFLDEVRSRLRNLKEAWKEAKLWVIWLANLREELFGEEERERGRLVSALCGAITALIDDMLELAEKGVVREYMKYGLEYALERCGSRG